MIRALAVLAILAVLGACSPAPSGPAASIAPGASPSGGTAPSPAPSDDPLGLDWAVIPGVDALEPLGGIRGLAANGGGIVATGDGTRWSADGRAWLVVEPGPDGIRLAADDGRFVAVGDGGAWTSRDGRTWTVRRDPLLDDVRIDRIEAMTGGFLAAGARGERGTDDARLVILRSTDGVIWSEMSGAVPPEERPDVPIAALAGSGETWLALTREGDENLRAVGWTSTDGATWTAIPSPTSIAGTVADATDLAGGGFVAVGIPNDTVADLPTGAWISPDGRAWRFIGPVDPDAQELRAVARSGAWVVVAGTLRQGGTAFWRSRDGIAWGRAPDMPSFELATVEAIEAGPAGFVATGRPGHAGYPDLVWTSPSLAPEPAATGTWAAGPDLPVTSGWAPAAATGDAILTFGDLVVEPAAEGWATGRSGATRALEARSDRWVDRAAGPIGASSAAVAADGTVWLLGDDPSETQDDGATAVSVYDPFADAWTAGPPIPRTFNGVDAVFLPDGDLFAVGRAADPLALEAWVLPAGGSTWREAGVIEWRDGLFDLASAGDHVYLYGIVREGERTLAARLVRVDPDDAGVEELAAPDLAVWTGELEALPDGRVVLACGSLLAWDSGGGIALRRVDVYDPAADRWTYLTSVPRPCSGAGVTADAGGRLWIVGGGPAADDLGPPQPTTAVSIWSQ